MKLVLLALAAGCMQTNSVPPEARWSGPYHKGSGNGRGYSIWLEPNLTAADDAALARKRDAVQ
jgi:hypothetical protein